MKTFHVVSLVALAIAVTVVVEEMRISALRREFHAVNVADGMSVATPKTAKTPAKETAAELPARTKNRPVADPSVAATAAKPEEDSMAKTVRKMFDNPAGKSLMNQQTKMVVGMMYQDFISTLNLSNDEQEYFKDLMSKDVSSQQELGMKMLGATPEEQKALVTELEKRKVENKAEIEKFLNNDADVKAFETYEQRMPEHQQVAGIRAVMSGAGEPLDAATEGKLVDAMYRARTESGAPDLSGANGLDALAKGNITEVFEKSWDSQQAQLRQETGGILSDKQQTAFQDYQKQTKEMQLMGLKMAEKMFPKDKGDGKK